MSYTAVLFDFDGTLADSLPRALEIYNEIAPRHGVLPVTDPLAAREMSMAELMRAHRITVAKLPGLMTELLRRQGEVMRDVPLIPGIPEIIRSLHDAGMRLGIVSSNSQPNIRVCLRRHGLEPCFELIVGYSRLLGKQQALRGAVRRLEAKPARVLYVGDEVRDIDAARRAGLDVAAVTWGLNSDDLLRRRRPDYLLEVPTELLRFASGAGGVARTTQDPLDHSQETPR